MNTIKGIGSHAKVIKPIVFRLVHKNETPATEGRYYPGLKRLPSKDDIFDPENNTKRRIQYSISEPSIYKDEQASHIELTDIIFTNGTLTVYEDNPTLLSYLRLCNWNRGNPNSVKGKKIIFFEYNPQEVAKELLEADNLMIDAGYKARHMGWDQLKVIARGLNMNIERSAEEVRHDVTQYAKANPEHFMSAVDDPFMNRKANVLDMAELGLLVLDARAIYTMGKSGKDHVFAVPVGQSNIDAFTEFTLSDKDGEELWKMLEKSKKRMLG